MVIALNCALRFSYFYASFHLFSNSEVMDLFENDILQSACGKV